MINFQLQSSVKVKVKVMIKVRIILKVKEGSYVNLVSLPGG